MRDFLFMGADGEELQGLREKIDISNEGPKDKDRSPGEGVSNGQLSASFF
jgi:hypothetical protein